MKLRIKKNRAVAQRRQRSRGDQAAPKASYTNYARRADHELNTGRLSAAERNVVADRAKKHVRSFWLPRFGMVILLIALALSTVNILSLSTDAKVVPLTSDAALLQNQTVYQSAASKLLSQSVMNRSKVTMNASHISGELQKQFPELASVDVTIPLLAHRPVVYVQAARPAIVLASSSGSFVISSTGKVLAPSSQISEAGRAKLPAVTDQGGISLAPNAQAFTGANIRFIETVVARLTAKGFNPAAITLPRAAGEVDVQIANQPFIVKFNLQSNTPREQAGTFMATMAQLKRQNATPSKYVDVRVEGRSYYL